ncbi:alpha/beta fold hydrolase [Amycolatopsis nigrescens]|uniref:alpha/beta fold hydrolase n=1 Tax=Amycolatopsis nigrescens TaxID=381445 RepID=UPI0003665B87|nr:alpha/beta fold hydrolase [Amycolatopsis nigrescens]
MVEKLVHVNGVDLCVETFGDPAEPAILLIGGATSSMDWWEDEFCERLAAGLRFVLRYDSRDTGRSTSYPAGAPPYSQLDLTADAVGLLDAFGLAEAHVVGISMGGGIGQRLGVEFPDRVSSLTLISTSPGGPGGPANPDLPPMSERIQALFAEPAPDPDWSDRAAMTDHMVAGYRPFAGSCPVDQERERELAGRIFDRTTDIAASMTNHWIIEGGDPIRHRLGDVTAPTLVLHGTEDPLFPFGHAEALAREIPGSDLVALAGVGHQMPPRQVWDVVVPAILRHTSGGWERQADRLAAQSLATGSPTGWFERLYQAGVAGETTMPWDRRAPHPLLTEWAHGLRGEGRSALVVGCGFGADAEFVAGLGFETVAFDISDTAVRLVRARFPESPVEYLRADLFEPPAGWQAAFDLVVEIFTVQALPDSVRDKATAAVANLVGPGGTLLAIEAVREDPAVQGPPWPLTRREIESFATGGLTPVRVEEIADPHRWRAEFRRPR